MARRTHSWRICLVRGKGLTGHDDVPAELQIEWGKELAKGGWLGIDFPKSIGGRECSLVEQVLFHKTYVEALAPGRIPNMGVTLLGPTLMAFGTNEQQSRFVPPILSGMSSGVKAIVNQTLDQICQMFIQKLNYKETNGS